MVRHGWTYNRFGTLPVEKCSANQWTGFYMIATSVIKELNSRAMTEDKHLIDMQFSCEQWRGFFYFETPHAETLIQRCSVKKVF